MVLDNLRGTDLSKHSTLCPFFTIIKTDLNSIVIFIFSTYHFTYAKKEHM
jgi:hypothetical protein